MNRLLEWVGGNQAGARKKKTSGNFWPGVWQDGAGGSSSLSVNSALLDGFPSSGCGVGKAKRIFGG